MLLRALIVAAVAVGLTFADNVPGPTGANNASTPTTYYEGVTIHYVTVGKATNEFVVRKSTDMTWIDRSL